MNSPLTWVSKQHVTENCTSNFVNQTGFSSLLLSNMARTHQTLMEASSRKSINFFLLHDDTYIEGILPKGPYLPCVSMMGKVLLAGYPPHMQFLLTAYIFFIKANNSSMSASEVNLHSIFCCRCEDKVNSLCLSDAIWWHKSGSALVQAMLMPGSINLLPEPTSSNQQRYSVAFIRETKFHKKCSWT